MSNRLQVGIDFSHKRADLALLASEGQPIVSHRAFANSMAGYAATKELLLETLGANQFDGLDISGEATSYYWLPFFLQLAADPDLEAHDLRQYLLNPRWVRWFKKCMSPDHKTDRHDPYYIAERTRVIRNCAPWSPHLDTLALRFYTRLRFHLVQDLTREKCFHAAHLFLKASAYRQVKPFHDVFGVCSSQVLSRYPTLDELAAATVDELASQLHELSNHSLPDPTRNAEKLKQVATDSFALPEPLVLPLQRLLDLTLQHIHFLEDQIAQVEAWITAIAPAYPGIGSLTSIPGVGPVFSSGIVAEVGDLQRFLDLPKWDKRHRRYRQRNLRDVEDAVAKIAGLWWPHASSGDFEAEDRRLAKSGNRYLRYYLVQAADHMRRDIPEYAKFYELKYQEATKHKHKRALVLTARKSVGLIVGLLHRVEAYRSEET